MHSVSGSTSTLEGIGLEIHPSHGLCMSYSLGGGFSVLDYERPLLERGRTTTG